MLNHALKRRGEVKTVDRPSFLRSGGQTIPSGPQETTGGIFMKDTYVATSRVNLIERAAKVVPGPGIYPIKNDWKNGTGSQLGESHGKVGKRGYQPVFSIGKAQRFRDNKKQFVAPGHGYCGALGYPLGFLLLQTRSGPWGFSSLQAAASN